MFASISMVALTLSTDRQTYIMYSKYFSKKVSLKWQSDTEIMQKLQL